MLKARIYITSKHVTLTIWENEVETFRRWYASRAEAEIAVFSLEEHLREQVSLEVESEV